MKKKEKIVIFNLSGCYELQDFYKGYEHIWLDEREKQGTNCYLDGETEQELKKQISEIPFSAVHFLDSGNYHYFSCLLMENITEDFSLVMMDHHTDLQMPAFGGILSCGGWLRELLERNEKLKKVWLIGPQKKDFQENSTGLTEKVCYLSEEDLINRTNLIKFIRTISSDLPVYFSLDKDVFCKEEVPCNWDQGILSVEDLIESLELFIKEKKPQILGIDICGETDFLENEKKHLKNSEVNKRLLDVFMEIV